MATLYKGELGDHDCLFNSIIQEYMRICKNYQLWLVKSCARMLHDREHFNCHFPKEVLKSFFCFVCRNVKNKREPQFLNKLRLHTTGHAEDTRTLRDF